MSNDNTGIFLCKSDKEHIQNILNKYYLIYNKYLLPIVKKQDEEFDKIKSNDSNDDGLSDVADLFFTSENCIIAAWICFEYHKWQQLIWLHISHEKLMMGFKIEDCLKDNDEGNIPLFEKYYRTKFNNFKTWRKIDEMRFVVNVIKHFTGQSYKKLKKLRPDLFYLYDEFDAKKMAIASGEFMLNLTNDDYISYHNSLVEFLEELYLATNDKKS